MKIPHRLKLLLLLLPLALAACATTTGAVEVAGPTPGELTTTPACAGSIAPAPEGARAVVDDALLQSALGAPGEGQLCAGAVFEATAPLQVYRAWTAAKPWSEVGRWWSLAPPSGSLEQYRAENAICPEWSDLDRLSVCTLKVGARFVMGPGQSATCEASAFPQSPVNQVFIDNDTRQERVFVEGCRPVDAWPPQAQEAP